jgi:hypothetical protein
MSAKTSWKNALEKHLDKYRQKRNRNDRQTHNEFYRHKIPSLKNTKDYLRANNILSRAKFEAITNNQRTKCPLCAANDICLARHIISKCGYLYKPRHKLTAKLKVTKNRHSEVILNKILSGEDNPDTLEFAITAAHTIQYAKRQLTVTNCEEEDLVGKIVDIRQNEKWYRCRITHRDNGRLTIDSQGLDSWPFDYFDFPLDTFRDTTIKIHGKSAIILRDNNCLSFTELDRNQGKVIFLNGTPLKLIKSLGKGTYRTNKGKINLKDLINKGKLNSCFINGDVAKRHASAFRREPKPSAASLLQAYTSEV